MSFCLILLAAGDSKRFNSKIPKPFVKIAGKTLLEHSLRKFSRIKEIKNTIVVIKKKETAISGDIVVALIDDNEVTLKKFRSNKNSIALEPANSSYKTRIFGPERVKIQGILAGLIRKF